MLMSMLSFAVLLISIATPARLPKAKALNPAPPSEPYLINVNWPLEIPARSRLIVTVEVGVNGPLTLIIGAVGLPNVLGLKVNVEPPLSVSEDIFNEVPALATCVLRVALVATVYAPAPVLAVVTAKAPALTVVLPV